MKRTLQSLNKQCADWQYRSTPNSQGYGLPDRAHWISEFAKGNAVVVRLEYEFKAGKWTGNLVNNLPEPESSIFEKNVAEMLRKLSER